MDGRILAYRFPGELGLEARNALRELVARLAFSTAPGRESAWECEEADSTGRYLSRYELDEPDPAGTRSVRRRKLCYTAMGSFGTTPPIHEVSGTATGLLGPDDFWPRQLTFEESLVLEIPLVAMELRITSTGTAELTGTGRVHLDDKALADAWTGPWHPATGEHEDLSEDIAQAEANEWREKLEGVTLEQALRGLRAALELGDQGEGATRRVVEALSWLLRFRPELASGVGQMIVASSEEPRMVRSLLQALAGAGHQAAEAELVGLLEEPGLTAAVTLAMFALDTPSALVADRIADGVVEAAVIDEWNGDQERMLLLLGALVGKSGELMIQGKPALEALVGLEELLVEAGQVGTWLEALGNTRSPDVMTHAMRYTADATPQVRGAAAAALRFSDTPATRRVLIDLAARDASPAVRNQAQFALSFQTSPEAKQEMLGVVRDHTEPSKRVVALNALSPWVGIDDHATHVVEQLAEGDPDAGVRDAAQDLLGR